MRDRPSIYKRNLTVQVHKLVNFSDEEKKKFMKAMNKLEYIVNTDDFREAVLLHDFDQTKGMDNVELYNEFMSGKTPFNETSDRDIDVYLTLYYSFRNVVGYTKPSTWKTWINRKFFTGFSDAEVCMNVIHEDRHNAGYGHISASDHDSIPYAFGYIVRDLLKGKIPPTRYTKKKVYRLPWYKRLFRWLF